ncbi:cell wall hydrolase [Paenibacillus donghaensis]|uniref:Cell wall hydrolase SleB domain-containing protein n=1 Tax=Paenibacillus donghaensis TaxID=414771 RepID=A0A2Z2KGZ4_9BACL|nr:cell wall hydrolase [Paenibacillus donghaensis]ASA26056.1 hypothetical protein B9T62_38315 [Paenibacillus donghaensis]
MLIFKQNRYIALLVGVILVCFSAISLMSYGQVAEGGVQETTAKLANKPSTTASGLLRTSLLPDRTRTAAQQSKLKAAVIQLSPAWTPEHHVEMLSYKDLEILKQQKLAREKASQAQAVMSATKAAALKAKQQAQTVTKGSQTASKKVAASLQHPPTTLFFTRTKLLPQDQQSKATWNYTVSDEDLLLLQKIVMAEAEGEPYQGKVAVANVVLNRLRSANFPDTIYKVIYQKSQFSPVANGRLKRVKPNKDSVQAVNAALSGVKEVTDDTYFFLSLTLAQDLTVHHSQTYAKTIGNHTFYK